MNVADDDLVSIINKNYNNYITSPYIPHTVASFKRYILIGPAIEIFFTFCNQFVYILLIISIVKSIGGECDFSITG